MNAWRILSGVIAFAVTFSHFGFFAAYGAEMNVSNSKTDSGVVGVSVSTNTDKRIRIGIHAAGGDKEYYFTYDKKEGDIDIPLIFGNGKYEVRLYEEVNNNYYMLCDTYSVDLQMEDYDAIYLSSSVIVPWGGAEKTIAKAGGLTKLKKNDFDKFTAIYKYVTENVIYDMTREAESGYRSSPDTTLAEGSGICLDIAVLLASMLRCSGIKCKLVYGRSSEMEGTHSWNEVYLNDKWVVVDPTKDSLCYVSQKPYKYAKLPKFYKSVYSF